MSDAEATAALAALRARFDDVDDRLLALIAERLRLADEAAPLKAALGRPAFDPGREAEARARRAAVIAGLSNRTDEDGENGEDAVSVADDVFEVLVRASRARQERYLAIVASRAP